MKMLGMLVLFVICMHQHKPQMERLVLSQGNTRLKLADFGMHDPRYVRPWGHDAEPVGTLGLQGPTSASSARIALPSGMVSSSTAL